MNFRNQHALEQNCFTLLTLSKKNPTVNIVQLYSEIWCRERQVSLIFLIDSILNTQLFFM